MIENYGNVRAVLNELRLALKNLRETGETYSIYIEKTGLSEEEREQELRELRGDYDTVSDSIIINIEWSDPVMDPDAELPFS